MQFCATVLCPKRVNIGIAMRRKHQDYNRMLDWIETENAQNIGILGVFVLGLPLKLPYSGIFRASFQ